MREMMRNEAEKSWLVPSDLSEVQKASAKALDFLQPLHLTDAYLFDIRLCLEEAMINAMKYGNALHRDTPVSMGIGYNDKKVWIRIEDRGPGFDVAKIGNCTEGDNLLKHGGRGVYLIHQLMDEVKYNAKGNSLLMIKMIRKDVETPRRA